MRLSPNCTHRRVLICAPVTNRPTGVKPVPPAGAGQNFTAGGALAEAVLSLIQARPLASFALPVAKLYVVGAKALAAAAPGVIRSWLGGKVEFKLGGDHARPP